LEFFREKKKRLIFVTNNSTKSRSSYVDKFLKFGIEVEINQIYGSSYAAAYYLAKIKKFDRKVFIIGSQGIKDEFESQGIQCSFLSDEDIRSDIWSVPLDPEVGAVIVGFDIHFNYFKLAVGHRYIVQNECEFFATNADSTYPTANGPFPGTGSILSSLITSTGKSPKIFGKPHHFLMDCIKDVETPISNNRNLS
jgi:4-nitrophenyl phosphatase